MSLRKQFLMLDKNSINKFFLRFQIKSCLLTKKKKTKPLETQYIRHLGRNNFKKIYLKSEFLNYLNKLPSLNINCVYLYYLFLLDKN